jgi:adenylate kinase
MRLILLGGPGSGKGTQADFLKAKYGCIHISTGDILRENLRKKTDHGLRAEAFMSKGELVPDDIMLDIVDERLRKDDIAEGFVMDGFPRDIPQAEAFDKMLNKMKWYLDAVIFINADEEVLVRRLTNRTICRVCGKVLSLLDIAAGTKNCIDCGGELYQRNDDNEQVIRHRIKIYKEQTEPLAAWYEDKGLLRTIEAKEHYMPKDTFKAIEAALSL